MKIKERNKTEFFERIFLDFVVFLCRHHDVKLTDGAWSESKPSVFYTTRSDGCLDGWDILQKQKDPILTIKVKRRSIKILKN